MPRATTSHLIRAPRSARALASSIRQEIVDALESAGPSTIAAIAILLEKKPDALYFHIRALERVGLVKRTATNGTGRKAAAVYDVPGRPMQLDYSGSATARAERLGPTLDSLLRLARRDVRRALTNPEARGEGEARDLWVARARGRVGPDGLRRINELLGECARIVREAEPSPDAIPVALAFALTPLSESHARHPGPVSGSGRSGSPRRSP